MKSNAETFYSNLYTSLHLYNEFHTINNKMKMKIKQDNF